MKINGQKYRLLTLQRDQGQKFATLCQGFAGVQAKQAKEGSAAARIQAGCRGWKARASADGIAAAAKGKDGGT